MGEFSRRVGCGKRFAEIVQGDRLSCLRDENCRSSSMVFGEISEDEMQLNRLHRIISFPAEETSFCEHSATVN
jgi:hypothetical protein